ncbi:septin CDC11 [Sugiyamaella lignohabitans]|uniref:Septin CDC11 n=1 Tax=Sugiyamaella lignohabitans TaxID=796027 RepID=A0A167EFG5_9ASCO|nr:septin CDC11 [Sugiyamaella lignohabitans]ANB14014.1 septin CDC11 [Sugiyamaella lignohabitans]
MSSYSGLRKKAVKKIQFTVMVCGASGTGRTSFINTLCGQNVIPSSDLEYDPRNAHLEKGIEVRPIATEIEDPDGTRIALTIIDTPGFGDNIDNSECFDKIVGYLEFQYDEVLAEESRIRRNPRFKDNRVHVCLYFIESTGHGLRELDVEMMKKLSHRVNVIPVIGRADSLTPLEKTTSKRMIMEDLKQHNIPIFNFPYDPEEDDPETIQDNSELREMLPFAVVSGNEIIQTATSGRRIYGRVYPWGYVDVEDPSHSDFISLRSALFGSHLMDLKDLTHDYLYENYRTEKLSGTSAENVRASRLLNAEDLANQSYLLKGEQLAREEEKLREIELRVQREINEKRLELTARENELRAIEARLSRERSVSSSVPDQKSISTSNPGTPIADNTGSDETGSDSLMQSPSQENITRVTSNTTSNTAHSTNAASSHHLPDTQSPASFVSSNAEAFSSPVAVKQEI